MARQLAKIVLRPIAENVLRPIAENCSPPYCREFPSNPQKPSGLVIHYHLSKSYI